HADGRLGDEEEISGIDREIVKRLPVGGGERIGVALALAAERVVGEERNDRRDVGAPRGADQDLCHLPTIKETARQRCPRRRAALVTMVAGPRSPCRPYRRPAASPARSWA